VNLDAPFVVIKLEECEVDEGHSTLTVHGDSEIVGALGAAVALMAAALAEETGGDLFDPSESPSAPEEDLADAS
jgi:hypothetical protein